MEHRLTQMTADPWLTESVQIRVSSVAINIPEGSIDR